MNFRNRMRQLEKQANKFNGGCDCPCVVPVGRGETVKPCGVCGKLPSSFVLPSLEDFATIGGIPLTAKIYAGFNFELV